MAKWLIRLGIGTAFLLFLGTSTVRGATISGKVVKTSKAGIGGVTVTLWGKTSKGYTPSKNVTTASSGAYSFTSVAAGSYKVSARIANSLTNYYADRWYDAVQPSSMGYVELNADVLSVGTSTTLTGRDITLVTGGRIATGLKIAGKKFNGIYVRAHTSTDYRIHHNHITKTTWSGATSSAGRAVLNNLPAPYDYNLYYFDINAKYETLAHPATVVPATVSAGGTVTLADATMKAMVADPYETNNAHSDGKALFSNSIFKKSPPGKYITSGALIGPRNADIDWYCWDTSVGDRYKISVDTPFNLYKVGGKPIEDPWVDPILALYTITGGGTVATRLKTDDDGGPGLRDALMDTGILSTGGRYCAVVSMYGDTTWKGKNQKVAGRYRLTIAMGNRRPALTGQYASTYMTT